MLLVFPSLKFFHALTTPDKSRICFYVVKEITRFLAKKCWYFALTQIMLLKSTSQLFDASSEIMWD